LKRPNRQCRSPFGASQLSVRSEAFERLKAYNACDVLHNHNKLVIESGTLKESQPGLAWLVKSVATVPMRLACKPVQVWLLLPVRSPTPDPRPVASVQTTTAHGSSGADVELPGEVGLTGRSWFPIDVRA
jgi:hypothetical protein